MENIYFYQNLLQFINIFKFYFVFILTHMLIKYKNQSFLKKTNFFLFKITQKAKKKQKN